jgi:hypothetical protein
MFGKLTPSRYPKAKRKVTCIDLGSISSTFYVQLLRVQIPKAEKDTDSFTKLLCFWDLRV